MVPQYFTLLLLWVAQEREPQMTHRVGVRLGVKFCFFCHLLQEKSSHTGKEH